MTARQQNLALVGILVVILAVAAYFLRTPSEDAGSAVKSPSPSASATTSASGSATTSASASAAPSPSPSPSVVPITKVAFIGDSFTAGTGASTPAKRWTTLLASANRWTETNLGHPQTGYLRAGTQAPCTAETCPNYQSSVAAAVQAAPQLVIVSGGANDLDQDQAAATAAVTKTLTDLKAGLPSATIVVVNPWWDMRKDNPALPAYTEAIKAAAAAVGVTYADTGQPLTGHVDRVTSDGLQANDLGHQVMADGVKGALKLAGVPVK